MITQKISVMMLVAAALMFPGKVLAEDNEPTLLKAEFVSHTINDKDSDTGVYVYIDSNDGKTHFAQIENADNSSKRETGYDGGSDHTVKLTVLKPSFTKQECMGFKVTVAAKANGSDKWQLNGRTTLYFSDGTKLVAAKEGMVLNSRGSKRAEDSFSNLVNR